MRILFAVKDHLPLLGGAEWTTDALAAELRRRGHEVTVFARQDPRRPPLPDRNDSYGYPTLRSGEPERDLREVLDSTAPAVVVVGGYHAELCGWSRSMLAGAAHLPTVLHLHDFGAAPLVAEKDLRIDRVVAVSAFVARLAREHGVEADHIPPAVERRRYRVDSSRRVALFVNPVPQKGLETVLRLARARPDIPFAFARCWYIAPDALERLAAEARSLGNVEIRDAVHEPARLYGDARVLLVPSDYPEAWARVAPEAQMSGIPVLAAAVGGLPEAVGSGGVLLDAEAGVAEWTETLGRLWDDPGEYERCSSAAERQGRRHDLSPSVVGDSFEAVLLEVTGRRRTAARRLRRRQ